jgi:hypothetical protein
MFSILSKMKNKKVKQVLSGAGTSEGGDIRKGCKKVNMMKIYHA